MRIANLSNRLVLLQDGGAIDVEEASDHEFSSDPQAVYERWADFCAWAGETDAAPTDFDPAELAAPVPRPRQVFAIGLNYGGHAAESGLDNPAFPPTFTKFPTCLTGPDAIVELSGTTVDWEVELVAVIGALAQNVAEDDAWSHIAGLTIGQDLSDRTVQLRPPAPQFSLGKSFPGYGPTGPWIVTPDEFDDPDDLALSCTINGEVMQSDRTSGLIFTIPMLVNRLSAITPLLPGDLIFTGTPSGVGGARKPPRFLAESDVLETTIEGIGSIRTRFSA